MADYLSGKNLMTTTGVSVAEEIGIACGTALDMDTVNELHGALMEALGQGKTLALDLSEVSSFDTAGLQLLCVVAGAAKSRGVELQFCRPQESLTTAVRVLDLQKYVGNWPSRNVV